MKDEEVVQELLREARGSSPRPWYKPKVESEVINSYNYLDVDVFRHRTLANKVGIYFARFSMLCTAFLAFTSSPLWGFVFASTFILLMLNVNRGAFGKEYSDLKGYRYDKKKVSAWYHALVLQSNLIEWGSIEFWEELEDTYVDVDIKTEGSTRELQLDILDQITLSLTGKDDARKIIHKLREFSLSIPPKDTVRELESTLNIKLETGLDKLDTEITLNKEMSKYE